MAWTKTGSIGGGRSIVTLASDVSASSTLSSLSGLLLPVEVGTYRFLYHGLFVVSGGTAATYRAPFTAPAWSYAWLVAQYQVVAGTALPAEAYQANSLSSPASGSQTNAATTKFCRVHGEITFTAAGNLQVQHQLGGTTPAGSTKAGSRLILEKLS